MQVTDVVDVLERFQKLSPVRFGPLDLLPYQNPVEKMIELALSGPPPGPPEITGSLAELAKLLNQVMTDGLKLVILGGGTGLSNIIGGDSRKPGWVQQPFSGLKEIFPQTAAIVCITDDGGSTGELLKELPIIALGDIRHVLLSSVQSRLLQSQYGLTETGALQAAGLLHRLFNFRFPAFTGDIEALLQATGILQDSLPPELALYLRELAASLFVNPVLSAQLSKPHCLGNLLLAAVILRHNSNNTASIEAASIMAGLREMARMIGANPNSALPCTTTPAQLKVLYSNGVMVTGEYKSGHARRGYPMDQVFVEFSTPPELNPEVRQLLETADIIVFAPGSLFTSIIPIMQVPGIAEAVRANRQALKILIANLWIQRGETDLVPAESGRRYYVSDLLMAYHRNIPGGVTDLFQQVLVLALRDIPGSILQNYALEAKIPIYLDREEVGRMGFELLEANIFSQSALREHRVIQHDPMALARTIRTIWAVRSLLPQGKVNLAPAPALRPPLLNRKGQAASARMAEIRNRLTAMAVPDDILKQLDRIFWDHKDIRVEHLASIRALILVEPSTWKRCQEWDNIFSFYDPLDRTIKIRQDIPVDCERFEVAFLVALGQSLLGDYAADKRMETVLLADESPGRVFKLRLRPPDERTCFFSQDELDRYLCLVRMVRSQKNSFVYTRLVNGNEGFTPPGLLFGLTYAWYLNNLFTAHIEYKMAITRNEVSDLIPEQVKILDRRRKIIDFFRTVVFGHDEAL